MNNLRVGVIGIGNMGSAHANCIAKGEINGLELTAICDINSQKLCEFSKTFSNVNTYTDYKKLLNSRW